MYFRYVVHSFNPRWWRTLLVCFLNPLRAGDMLDLHGWLSNNYGIAVEMPDGNTHMELFPLSHIVLTDADMLRLAERL